MKEKAIRKLKSEMEKEKNTYVQVVGQFLLQHIEQYPEDAEKVLNEDKTIMKSLEAMRQEASKKKVGNCAVLTDQEGYEIVLKYFEIETKAATSVIKEDQTVPKPVKSDTKSNDFDVKLEDFL